MTDPQINAALAIVLGMALAGAFFIALALSVTAPRRVKPVGWSLICAVVAAGAATWAFRHEGSLLHALIWGAGGAVAAWVVLAGAEARVATTNAMFNGVPRGVRRPPTDFSA